MYAIVDIAGQQFRVEKGQKVFVHRLGNEEGETVEFDQVLLLDNDGKISIGEPLVDGAFIEGKVLTHLKGDKVIVFKKKRRKGYQKRNGHRQFFSQIEVLSINEKGAVRKAKKASIKVEADEVNVAAEKSAPASKPVAAKAKAEVKTPVAKKSEAAPKKVAASTKPAAKKPAAKKPAAAKKPVAAKKPAAAKSSAKPKADNAKGKASDKAKK